MQDLMELFPVVIREVDHPEPALAARIQLQQLIPVFRVTGQHEHEGMFIIRQRRHEGLETLPLALIPQLMGLIHKEERSSALGFLHPLPHHFIGRVHIGRGDFGSAVHDRNCGSQETEGVIQFAQHASHRGLAAARFTAQDNRIQAQCIQAFAFRDRLGHTSGFRGEPCFDFLHADDLLIEPCEHI